MDYLVQFQAQAQKKSKKSTQKNFLYFRKWNFLAAGLKNFLYLRKWNFLAPRLKIFLYFR